MRRWAPVELSPIDVWVDGRVLVEGVERGGIVVCHLEELFECPNAGVFFLEKLDNCYKRYGLLHYAYLICRTGPVISYLAI